MSADNQTLLLKYRAGWQCGVLGSARPANLLSDYDFMAGLEAGREIALAEHGRMLALYDCEPDCLRAPAGEPPRFIRYAGEIGLMVTRHVNGDIEAEFKRDSGAKVIRIKKGEWYIQQ